MNERKAYLYLTCLGARGFKDGNLGALAFGPFFNRYASNFLNSAFKYARRLDWFVVSLLAFSKEI